MLASAETSLAQEATPTVPPPVLAALRDTIQALYVDPIPSESLSHFASAEALIGSLRDRHTILFSPGERKEFEVGAGIAFGGIGARVGVRNDTTVIAGVEPGSPAERAKLRPFDRIVGVDSAAVVGFDTDSVIALIRGPVGTAVSLGLIRGLARSPLRVVVVREAVQVPSVPAGALLPSGVGIVKVAQFGPHATRDAVQALDWMVQGGARGVILDLRDNPGGALEEALEMAQLFLPAGAGLVEVRGRPGSGVQTARSRQAPRYPKLPLAVLINERSASAAEVLASALQEGKRALIAGRQSYGKGSVQHIADLPEGWAVKLTIARWYTPKGRPIDRGVQPAGVMIDPTAPHEGGVRPDLNLSPDSAAALVAVAAMALGPRWDSLNLAILAWVETAADSMKSPTEEFEVDRPTVEALLERTEVSSVLPRGTQEALRQWMSDAMSRGVVAARLGLMQEGAWALMHDPEVRRVAQELNRKIKH
jgi:carboxyl-terminal processing protease